MAIEEGLGVERLKDLLDYDPETGLFRWRRYRARGARAGDVAGSLCEGYVNIQIDGVTYRGHRLAWLYVTGRAAENEIDHINGDRADNRLANLRTATRAENRQNLHGPYKSGASGVLGVTRRRNGRRKPWVAQIQEGKAKRHLGYFASVEEASAAYIAAKREIHPYGTL